MGNMSGLVGANNEMQLYNQLLNIDKQLLGSVNQSHTLSQNVISQYGASNQSWDTFMQQKGKIEGANSGQLLQQYQTMNQEVKDVAKRRQEVVKKLENATGQTQALQAVGAALDILIGQNQQIVSALAAQGNVKISQKNVEEAANLKALKMYQEQQEKLKQAAAGVK